MIVAFGENHRAALLISQLRPMVLLNSQSSWWLHISLHWKFSCAIMENDFTEISQVFLRIGTIRITWNWKIIAREAASGTLG